MLSARLAEGLAHRDLRRHVAEDLHDAGPALRAREVERGRGAPQVHRGEVRAAGAEHAHHPLVAVPAALVQRGVARVGRLVNVGAGVAEFLCLF